MVYSARIWLSNEVTYFEISNIPLQSSSITSGPKQWAIAVESKTVHRLHKHVAR